MLNFLKKLAVGLAILIAAIFVIALFRFQDRHPGYKINLNLTGEAGQGIKAGFSKTNITPEGFDTWNDANDDGRYNEKDGDTYNDLNGNGRFDAVWLAGFHQSRPANGVNDSLWARSVVIESGGIRLALCVIDMIGLGNDEIVTIRKRIRKSLALDYVIVSSTHVHSSPDLLGMWGPSVLSRGVDPAYLELVIRQTVRSVEDACRQMRPARLRFAQDPSGAEALVGDSRVPVVKDYGIRLMQVQDLETNRTLGTLLNWSNHPETLWSKNVLITSDFPHYYRKFVEEGIYKGDSLVHKGLGGTAVFLNGAVGGLMTTRPNDTIRHPLSGEPLTGATFEKAEAQGMALALLSLQALDRAPGPPVDTGRLQIRARTIALPMDNLLFQLAGLTGVFKRGFIQWKQLRSEVSVWSIGPATFVHAPGELYPEILNGGVESPEGGDFGIPPVEVPAIASRVRSDFKFFVGLSNDMVGYIVPKSQWDEKAPYTYGQQKRPYGEINSLGPETAPIVHRSILELLDELEK